MLSGEGNGMLILEIAAGIWVATWLVKQVDTVACLVGQCVMASRMAYVRQMQARYPPPPRSAPAPAPTVDEDRLE
jgi:hypothetical protein